MIPIKKEEDLWGYLLPESTSNDIHVRSVGRVHSKACERGVSSHQDSASCCATYAERKRTMRRSYDDWGVGVSVLGSLVFDNVTVMSDKQGCHEHLEELGDLRNQYGHYDLPFKDCFRAR